MDLFAYQCGSPIVKANAIQGPIHPGTLGIAMDMSIQLKAANGAICTLSLSFNNDGPLGTFFRYIGDTGTYMARYDDLFNGKEEKIDVSQVDVSMNGIELQDREFFAAIQQGREPNASVAQVLPCYQVLHRLEQQLGGLNRRGQCRWPRRDGSGRVSRRRRRAGTGAGRWRWPWPGSRRRWGAGGRRCRRPAACAWGCAGSRMALSKSITASKAPLVRIQRFTAWRFTSPSAVK